MYVFGVKKTKHASQKTPPDIIIFKGHQKNRNEALGKSRSLAFAALTPTDEKSPGAIRPSPTVLGLSQQGKYGS